jgi:hypothetical protein
MPMHSGSNQINFEQLDSYNTLRPVLKGKNVGPFMSGNYRRTKSAMSITVNGS